MGLPSIKSRSGVKQLSKMENWQKITIFRFKVIELPQTDPYITGLKPRYHVGESLRANCTLEESYPAANITWLQNGHVAETRYVKNHQPLFSYTGRYT